MTIYDEAVTLAKEYIGPAGQQFIDRQLTNHLNLTPADLNDSNLLELSKWCFTSGRLIIDAEQARELQEKIVSLAK